MRLSTSSSRLGQPEGGQHLVPLVGLRSDVAGGERAAELADVSGETGRSWRRSALGRSFGGSRDLARGERHSPSVTRWLQSCHAQRGLWCLRGSGDVAPSAPPALACEPVDSPALPVAAAFRLPQRCSRQLVGANALDDHARGQLSRASPAPADAETARRARCVGTAPPRPVRPAAPTACLRCRARRRRGRCRTRPGRRASRSITSSSEVHSKTETPSLIKVTWVRSSTPRARRCSIAVRICCSEMPASISRLITLRIKMSRKL